MLFGANLASQFKKNCAGFTPFNGTIWNEFSEQHQHHIKCLVCTFLVQIMYKFNAHFSWDVVMYYTSRIILIYLERR